MSSGRMGVTALLAADQLKVLYVAPSDTQGIVNVNFCNNGAVNVKVRVAISLNPIPTEGEYVDGALLLPLFAPQNGNVLQTNGFPISPGEHIVVWCDTADVVSARANGTWKEDA